MTDWAGWWIDLSSLARAPFKPALVLWRAATWVIGPRRPRLARIALVDRSDPDWQIKWRKLRSWYVRLCERQLGAHNLCCMKCAVGFPPGMRHKMDVDHIVPVDVDPSRSLDPRNLQILCESCNSAKRNAHSEADYRPECIIIAVDFSAHEIIDRMVA